MEARMKKKVCIHFQKGSCSFGGSCRNLHPALDGKAKENARRGVCKKQNRAPTPKALQASVDDTWAHINHARLEHLKIIDELKAAANGSQTNTFAFDELDKKLVEQKVLWEKVQEAEAQLATFDSNVEHIVTENTADAVSFEPLKENAKRRIQREVRRLSPPDGKCLPFYAFMRDCVDTIRSNPVCIIVAETGSGKSTQLIQYCISSGLAGGKGKIACVQPRKVAATSLATRVALEWDGFNGTVGQSVGYELGGGGRRAGRNTCMKFVTTHFLLNEMLGDPLLKHYSVVIVDEAHERSIGTDLILGMLKRPLNERRDEGFRVVVTSATLDSARLQEYYDGCPVMKIPGRSYPVQVDFQDAPIEEGKHVEMAWKTALNIHQRQPPGDGHILTFLTGQDEIEVATQAFRDAMEAAGDSSAVALPLHGKLSPEDADKAFQPVQLGLRKVIFATNLAETSLTIDRVRYVVDTGLARLAGYDAKSNTRVVAVGQINRSAAEQRKGRAGRTGPGVCYRLYSRADYEEMAESETPEILRSNLGLCILQLKALGVKDVEHFDFVERPSAAAMAHAMSALRYLGCVAGPEDAMTESGRYTAELDMDPMLCRMVLKGIEIGVGDECLTMAALKNAGGNAFFRYGSTEEKALADRVKLGQSLRGGDVRTALDAFERWETEAGPASGKKQAARKAWCSDNFVNGKVMSGAHKTKKELRDKLQLLGINVAASLNAGDDAQGGIGASREARLQRAITEGFFLNIAMCNGPAKAGYTALTSQKTCALHPACSLLALQETASFVVFQDLVQTSRLFIQNVTPVDIETVREICPVFHQSLQLENLDLFGSHEFGSVSPAACRMFVGGRGANITALEGQLKCVIEVEVDKGFVQVWAPRSRLKEVVSTIEASLYDDIIEAHVAGSTRAVIGRGAVATELLRGGEFVKIKVRNVSNWEELLTTLRRPPFLGYAGARCAGKTSGGSGVSGVVTLKNTTEALLVRKELGGSATLACAGDQQSLLEVIPCVPAATGKPLPRQATSVTVCWSFGISKGHGFVKFGTRDAACEAASAMHGHWIGSNVVQCTYKEPPAPRAAPTHEMKMQCDMACVGTLIGRGGTTSDAIKEQSGVVSFVADRQKPGQITLKGSEESLHQAAAIVKEREPSAYIVLGPTQCPPSKKPTTNPLPSIRVSGLSFDTDENDLMGVFGEMGAISAFVVRGPVTSEEVAAGNMGDSDGVFGPTYDSEFVLAKLQSMLAAASKGLGTVEKLVLLPVSSSGLQCKALVTFSTAGCVAKAIGMFDGKPAAEFGLGRSNGKIRVTPDLTCTMRLPKGLANALKDEIQRVLETIQGQSHGAVRVELVSKGSQGSVINLNGNTVKPLLAARKVLEALLSPELFSAGDDGMLVSKLFSMRGMRACERISTSIAGSFVHCDCNARRALLYGGRAQREAAREQLTVYVNSCADDPVWTHELQPGQARLLVGRDGRGVDQLLESGQCSDALVTLDLQRQTLCVSGPAAALAKARALIEAELVASGPSSPRAKASESETHGEEPAGGVCGVCRCEVEVDKERMALHGCGHTMHRSCLSLMLQNHATVGGAPLPAVCVCNMDGGTPCGAELLLRDLEQACSPDTLSKLWTRAFQLYVDMNLDKLLQCPTPDCPQVVERSHPGTWLCDCCFRTYCVPCTLKTDAAVNEHRGISCADFMDTSEALGGVGDSEFKQFMFNSLRKREVRKCPNCNFAQSKDMACNHVTCFQCKKHWCYGCARFFADSSGAVYAHMGSCLNP